MGSIMLGTRYVTHDTTHYQVEADNENERYNEVLQRGFSESHHSLIFILYLSFSTTPQTSSQTMDMEG